MAGATSIVQLILKKWGDDIAGAAKELEEKVGFPESVANRIATGELPMDEASRLKRAQEQGYGDELYHGSTHDITEFNGQGNPSNDWGRGTYLTDDTYDASTNYAGEGPDLTNRIQTTKEQLADEITDRVRYSEDLNETLLDLQDEYGLDEHDMAKVRGWADQSGLISYRGGKFMPDHPDFMLNDESENLLASALTNTIARKQVKGGNEGVIYPVRVKQDGLLNVTDEVELPDYRAQAADELGYDYQKYVDENYDEDVLYEIEERADELQMDDYDSPNANLFGVGNDLDADMTYVESIYEGDTWNDVRNKLGDAVVYTDEDEVIGGGGVTAEVMSRGGATGVVDDYAPSRFPSMGAGRHTIMFPGSEDQIRSVNAAFDPEYTGKNIMGNATVPMLGGTAAITAGALAAPALMKDGVFQHTASETPIVERKEPVQNQSSLLESVTDFGDEVIKSAKHAAGPLSLLVPYEGINDYLKTVNDEDRQPTWMDRLGLLDF